MELPLYLVVNGLKLFLLSFVVIISIAGKNRKVGTEEVSSHTTPCQDQHPDTEAAKRD
jgi:hypothetical protein